ANLWTAWTSLKLAHPPTAEQKQKQRTFDALPKPANLISYRHPQARAWGQMTSTPGRKFR
ncbi:MAG: hypothetical protein ACLP7P_15695, partial [Rhodomicrobium sp.]